MNRKLFLRNALMSIAVSLLPELLRPMKVNADGCVPLIAGDEIPASPKYDNDKAYMITYPSGYVLYSHGSVLNEMDRIMIEQFKKQVK